MGRNRTDGATAASDDSVATPPEASAGKNFTSRQPDATTRISSVTVATPGTNGTEHAAAADNSTSLEPGLTANTAPAAIASDS